MDNIEPLYKALGKICFAIVKSNGSFSTGDKKKVIDIIIRESAVDTKFIEKSGFERLMEELNSDDFDDAYNTSMEEFKRYKYNLTDEMKIDFIATVEKIAYAYFIIRNGKTSIIDRFRHDLVAI